MPSTTKETRIALIMGGGVSLGSFSGGALHQCLELFEEIERGPAKIDVVSGASAGSMTLAVVIYHLFRGSPLAAVRDALHKSWVREIDFDRLRPADLRKHVLPSLLSDRVVRDIADGVLDTREPLEPQPHPLFAEGLLASFALTNLNGIPARADGQLIRQARAGGGAVNGPGSVMADALHTTFHQDAIRFRLCRRPTDDAYLDGTAVRLRPWRQPGPTGAADPEARRAWDLFREAAIASGAFPMAFPPVPIERHRPELPLWPDRLAGDSFPFDYADGGVLRNEPLREAIHLAELQDRRGEDFERVFILIDPNISGTREVFALPYNQRARLKGAFESSGDASGWALEAQSYLSRLGGVAGRLVGMLATQATFRDWIKTAHVNSQVEWRGRMIERLLPHLPDAPAPEVLAGVNGLLEEVYIERARRAPASPLADVDALSDAQRQQALEPMAADLAQRIDELEGHQLGARLLLLLDLIANLRRKRKLNMVAITPASRVAPAGEPPAAPLAGAFMAGFGGFFRREYREYDFQVGRHIAANVLATTPEGARRFLRDAPRSIPPMPQLPGGREPRFTALAPAVQQAVEHLATQHLETAVRQSGLPLVHKLVPAVLRGRVRRALWGMRDGQTAHVLLRIDCSQMPGVSRPLLRGYHGPAAEAGDDGVVETLLGIFVSRFGRGEVFGPHVTQDPGAAPRLSVYDGGGMLSRQRHVATVTLLEPPEAWLAAAASRAVGVVELSLGGVMINRPIRPGDVREHWPRA
jgi:predicted acylesterase/phospholipase RssA